MIYGASSCMATNLFFYYTNEELLCIYVDDHEKLIRGIHILYSCKNVLTHDIYFYQCIQQTNIGIVDYQFVYIIKQLVVL